MVRINGESVECAGISIEGYLLEAGYDLKRVAVELNGDIVPKAKYSDTYLCDGDSFDAIGISVAKYLSDAGYDIKRVAVELNGDILAKSQYENTILCDGDSVEVVSFVGGG